MSSPPTPISVADAKRRFSDVLGEVRYQGARFVVERNGTPMAAIVPLEDLVTRPDEERPRGLLSLVGAFADAQEYPESVSRAVRSRSGQRSRSVPPLHA